MKREGFCHRLWCDGVLAGAMAGIRCQPGSPSQQLAFILVCLDVHCPAASYCRRFGSRGYLRRKQNKTWVALLPLSPNFGYCLEMSPNISLFLDVQKDSDLHAGPATPSRAGSGSAPLPPRGRKPDPASELNFPSRWLLKPGRTIMII